MSDDQNYGPPEMRALIRAAAEHSVLSLPEALERLRAAEAERDRLREVEEWFRRDHSDVTQLLEAAAAERDRLRAEVHRCGDLLAEWTSDLAAVRAERDRLRAAVEAVRSTTETMRADVDHWATTGMRRLNPGDAIAQAAAIKRALRVVEDQLDGTGTIGDGDEDETRESPSDTPQGAAVGSDGDGHHRVRGLRGADAGGADRLSDESSAGALPCHHCGAGVKGCLEADQPCCPDCHHGGAIRHRTFSAGVPRD